MATEQQSEQLDRVTSAVMYYFVATLNGVLGKTHLQKLLFLTDLIASRRFGEPITKMKYVRYTHGPYSRELNDYIKKLESDSLIEERRLPFLSDPSHHYSRFYKQKETDAKKFLLEEVGAEKVLLVDEVAQSYGNKSLQEVLDFVYSLEEVESAPFDSPIKMAQDMGGHEDEDADDSPF